MKILVLPGDGIGKDVCNAALPVLKLFDIKAQLEVDEIGWECWLKYGNPIPDSIWGKIKNYDAILPGATTSKGKKEAEAELAKHNTKKNVYTSPIIQLRKNLDLFANIRPCELIYGDRKPFRLTVIRENTEGLYSGIDQKGIPNSLQELIKHPNIERSGYEQASFAIRLQTKYGLERLFNYAFDYAQKYNYSKVTLADKPNVLRESGQMAADIFYSTAKRYKNIHSNIENVDALALQLVRKPENYGVIVAENMFGDILSDLAAGLMGGLGFAPSANIGNSIPYFEPVHGSAPQHAGVNRVNPSAMFLTIALLLEHFNFKKEAETIKKAIKLVVKEGRHTTYDIGGNAGTKEMAQSILNTVEAINTGTINYNKYASIICVGNELLNGSTVNTNASYFAQVLDKANFNVKGHYVVADKEIDVINCINKCLQNDLIILSGGLGPTLDDITREAVAKAFGKPLIHNKQIEDVIEQKLNNIGIPIDKNSKKQSYFPQDSEIITNDNGLAYGFSFKNGFTEVIVLPGPPNECKPMVDSLFLKKIEKNPNKTNYKLLGINESELSFILENIFKNIDADKGIFWRYPYIDLEITFANSKDQKTVENKIYNKLEKFIVSNTGKSATEILFKYLDLNPNISITITKDATGGFLFTKFNNYIKRKNSTQEINIYTDSDTSFNGPFIGQIIFNCNINERNFKITIPKSRVEIKVFATEFVALSILQNSNVL
ncbi:MAG: isocitrate/isopropylmalate family dehydrogenase [Solitalea-like symbiont of Tyrophagus putrescentiae]